MGCRQINRCIVPCCLQVVNHKAKSPNKIERLVGPKMSQFTAAETKVIEQINEIFRNKGKSPPQIMKDTKIDDSMGLDSLDFAELVVRLEHFYGHDPFSSGKNIVVRTIADLASLYDSATQD